jgi:hypothetical protein
MVGGQEAGNPMKKLETVLAYVEKARSVGTSVEVVSRRDLADRLGALWDGLAGQDVSGSRVDDSRLVEDTGLPGSESEACGLVALPAAGWPEGLREAVESSLLSRGCRVVSPRRAGTGYGWERELLARARLGVTYCNAFLAETGSLVVSAGPGMGTLASLLPPVHLALSHPEACRGNLADYLSDLAGALPSRLTLITGPSRTGDIEASMTKGVHGPREVHHWILEDPVS